MRLARITWGMLIVALLLAAVAAPAQAEKPRPNLAALQSALESLDLYTAHVDGIYGPATKRAITMFQRRNGLEVDGKAGPATRKALGWRGRPSLGSREMKVGDRGWDVAGLQYLLARSGFGPGRIDAVFGPLTRQAVVRAQKGSGEEPTGRASSSLIEHLMGDPAPRSVRVRSRGSGRFDWPVSGPIGDGFGVNRGGGRVHQGVDFPVPKGTRVSSSAGGTVIHAGWNSGGYGNLVVIQHSRGYTTWYAHLSAITVRNGQRVGAGRRVGLVGSTGYSTGPHLHFEIRRYDTPVNPLTHLVPSASLQAIKLYSSGADAGGHSGEGSHDSHGHDLECVGSHSGASGRNARGSWIARETLCVND